MDLIQQIAAFSNYPVRSDLSLAPRPKIPFHPIRTHKIGPCVASLKIEKPGLLFRPKALPQLLGVEPPRAFGFGPRSFRLPCHVSDDDDDDDNDESKGKRSLARETKDSFKC